MNKIALVFVFVLAAVAAYLVLITPGGSPTGNVTGEKRLMAYECPKGKTIEVGGNTIEFHGFTKIGEKVACKGIITKTDKELMKCNPIEVLVYPKTMDVECNPGADAKECQEYCRVTSNIISAGSLERYMERMAQDPDCYMLEGKQGTEDMGNHKETLSFVGKKQLEGKNYCYSTIMSEPDVYGCGIIELYANPFTADIRCMHTKDEGTNCDTICSSLEKGIQKGFCASLGNLKQFVARCN